MDGLLMGFLARELQATLTGGRVDRITQPAKDMVILTIRNGGQNHRLLISATPTLAHLCLSDRSYENPKDAPLFLMLLRKHLGSARVSSVSQQNGDRVLRLSFESQTDLGDPAQKQLVFEAMGKHTNLTLVENGVILDAIRRVTGDMSRVRQILPGLPFTDPPAQDKLAPDALTEDALLVRLSARQGRLDKWLADNIMGLSAPSAQEIAHRLTGMTTPLIDGWDLPKLAHGIAQLVPALLKEPEPRLLRDPRGLPQLALPFPYLSLDQDSQQAMPSVSAALDSLFSERDIALRHDQRTLSLRKQLETALARARRKLVAQQDDLLTEAQMDELRLRGELLTAFHHQVAKGASETVLVSYYTQEKVKIPLDPALSAAQNAQKYYKRYQKEHARRKAFKEQQQRTQHEIDALEEALVTLDIASGEDDINELRLSLGQQRLLKLPGQIKKRKDKPQPPMKVVTEEGYTLLVGKNALQNDRLYRDSGPNDLWLHARNLPGAHVYIKAQGFDPTPGALGGNHQLFGYPAHVVEQAARLAARFSGGEGPVDVDLTLRRFLRKPSGAPLGFVTYAKEKTLRVEG